MKPVPVILVTAVLRAFFFRSEQFTFVRIFCAISVVFMRKVCGRFELAEKYCLQSSFQLKMHWFCFKVQFYQKIRSLIPHGLFKRRMNVFPDEIIIKNYLGHC